MILLPDLTQDEMVAWATARGLPAYRGRQLYAAVFRRLATSFDELTDLPRDLRTELAHVVYMGMGEPLLPYENTLKSVRLLTDPHGFGLGQRHVTISTAGIVPGIRRLAREGLQVGLAVSIHAATDEARSALMPLNRRYGLDELLDACRDYVEATHRRITFECTLIGGVNDGPDHARALAERLRGVLCHVNIIPWNRVDEIPFQPSSRGRVAAFRDVLAAAGLPVTVRDTRGSAI